MSLDEKPVLGNVNKMGQNNEKFDYKKGLSHGEALRFLQKHRGKPQYRHAPHIALKTSKILRPLSKKFGPGLHSLKSQWPHIVGEKWAKLSEPTRVKGARGEKTLIITAKGPACALIAADAANILARLEQVLGKGAITRLKVNHGTIAAKTPAPAKLNTQARPTNDLQSTLESTSDNTLEKALNRLEQKTKTRRKP